MELWNPLVFIFNGASFFDLVNATMSAHGQICSGKSDHKFFSAFKIAQGVHIVCSKFPLSRFSCVRFSFQAV